MIISDGNLTYDVKAFPNKQEGQRYFDRQVCNCKVKLSDTYGDVLSVVSSKSSLTQKTIFSVAFESDIPAGASYCLVSDSLDRWILQVDNRLFFVQPSAGRLVAIQEISTPLSSLYLWNHRIIVLEEARVRIANINGDILQSVNTDLIEDVKLVDSQLFIETIEGNRVVVDLAKG